MDIKIIIGTLIRGQVYAASGWLVAKGLLPQSALDAFSDATTSIAVGGLLLVGAYVWSFISKKKALDAPVPPSA